MTNQDFLLGVIETVLGRGKKTTRNNYAFHCPVCNHKKPKLEVNLVTEVYNCWTCEPPTKGRAVSNLFKKLKVPKEKLAELSLYSKYKIKGEPQKEEVYVDVTLPVEYKSLQGPQESLVARQARSYLLSRGLTYADICKYNIGYCETGRYANFVIIPSYDRSGVINYFVARSFLKGPYRKFDAPECNKREVIGFENLINWKVPVILCEGPFDAITIKRNAIPLFGKSITRKLMLKLVQPEVQTIYLVLDSDALKTSLRYCENFINLGKEIYLVDLEEKDPAEIGFEEITRLLQKATPLTITQLLVKKLELYDRN